MNLKCWLTWLYSTYFLLWCNFPFRFPLIEFSNILRFICLTQLNEPTVNLKIVIFVMMFRLTPVFCYCASFSSILNRKDFIWNLFIKWCPVVAMNLYLKHTYGPSGVLVEMWFQTLARFVLKNNMVCVFRQYIFLAINNVNIKQIIF